MAQECALEVSLPASRLHATIPRAEEGKICFVCSFLQQGDRNAGLPQKLPALGPRLPQQGNRPAGGSPLPGSFLPALLWAAQKKDGENKEKAKRGLPTLCLEHTDQTLLARKVLHTLKKQEGETGQCLERTDSLIIPIPETKARKTTMMFLLLQTTHVFLF